MSQGGAISSLVYASGAIGTAASMGYVFGRPTIFKKRRNSIHTLISNCSSNYSSTSCTEINSSPKSPLKRFKLFRSKSKESNEGLSTSSSTFIFPPKTVHLQAVRPEQLSDLADDDVSSICSDVFTMNDRDRRTLSVPNLPATLHQAQNWDNSPSLSGVYISRGVSETLLEEDEEDEDWDSQSDSGSNEPVNKSAKALSPTLPIPITPTTPTRRRHNRCNSLPPPNIHDFSPSLYHRRPTPSESWDDDFDIEVNELNVPSRVEENQISLRMDISNIKDFATHIRILKDLREKKENFSNDIQSKMTRRWSNGFLRTSSKKVRDLENLYKRDWEEAAVIIDIADVADNKTTIDDKRVEVDIEKIPSKRHMKIFKRIIVESLGEDAKDLVSFDDDKENQYDYNVPKNIAKKQKLMSFRTNNNKICNSEKRRENFRMSVEVMPSLVDRLKQLQRRLSRHVTDLETLTQH
ncbi:14553_t:CDS:2 [Funneliformis mosseae]|uniref:14553_t:CDS:1 n=1 Tax=Funneliformis mosseae TaxID=27381 RepID=A0A9N9D7B2_FUNMO|nr:14553_t:CDS:2 [Funneliformis mosseae]